jgi:hypothetical protein
MRGQIDDFLVVLDGLLVILFGSIQIPEIHVDIAENEFLADYLFGLIEVLFSLVHLVCLKAKGPKSVMIVACE